jgi:hypothetical protein
VLLEQTLEHLDAELQKFTVKPPDSRTEPT